MEADRGGSGGGCGVGGLALLGAAFLVGLASAAGARTLSVAPVADTYADANAPATSFGAASRLQVDGSPARVTYLRFVVSGSAGEEVTAARLRLMASSGSDDSAGRIHRISSTAWDEATLTWDTRPAVDGPVVHAHGPVASGAMAEFVLDGAVTGDGTYSFAIDATSGDGAAYYSSSSTGGVRPELVLTLQPRATTVTIVRPLDGAAFLVGDAVVLEGRAVAGNGSDLSATIAWTSSLDGPLGSGAQRTVTGLSPGAHVLTAAVTDGGGTTATDTVSIAVSESAATLTFPAVADTWVDSQTPAASFGSATLLRVDGSPTRQAFLRFEVTGTGGARVQAARVRLTVGPAGADASVSGGRLHVISNHDWTEAGTTWTFRPAVDGPVVAVQGAAAKNAVLDFDVTAAVAGDGTHDFALVPASGDGVGYRSREATTGRPALIVSLAASGGDQPPVVTIETPSASTVVGEGTALTFRGRAVDPEEGDVSASLRWTSSLDGPLGSGSSLTRTLSLGTHTITASGTDSGLRRGSASIAVTITRFPGYEDGSFGTTVETSANRATAEKPESKLWYHDGRWWGTLFDPAAGAHRIHRLDSASQTWIDDGTTVDARPRSRQDVLSLGARLYVVSRFAGTPAQNRLLRYTYTPAGHYQLDAGFPVNVDGGGAETVTLARDSTGTLWIAYVLGRQVRVNRTLGGDTAWGTPFVVPVPEGTTVGADDIAAVTALPGAIGVFWNSHVTSKFYFAVHTDGRPATDPASWRLETAIQRANVADDHVNVKVAADGRVFAAVKTDFTDPATTQIGLLVRSPAGVWSPLHQVAPVSVDGTRPQCVLDEERGLVHVFYSVHGRAIHYKSSPMNALAFPAGAGIPFIKSETTGGINNPTTTKQSVGRTSGVVVLASTSVTRRYWHNFIAPEP
jgi:hypothetical protein